MIRNGEGRGLGYQQLIIEGKIIADKTRAAVREPITFHLDWVPPPPSVMDLIQYGPYNPYSSVYWVFGDGSTGSGSLSDKVSYAYSNPGIYSVTAIVTDVQKDIDYVLSGEDHPLGVQINVKPPEIKKPRIAGIGLVGIFPLTLVAIGLINAMRKKKKRRHT